MVLEVHPLIPSDMPDLVRIQMSAFSTGVIRAMFPTNSPTYIPTTIAKHLKSMTSEPDIHYMKVIDTELAGGQMIACAKWRINLQERGQEEVEKMLPHAGKEEEGNEAAKAFLAYLRWARSKYMGGKPFYFLHMLVTDPAHHRRGAGALLVKWGTAQADAHGLPSFLESSEAGKPLYKRLGFVAEHEEVFDLAKWGGEGKDMNTIMIRQPVVQSE